MHALAQLIAPNTIGVIYHIGRGWAWCHNHPKCPEHIAKLGHFSHQASRDHHGARQWHALLDEHQYAHASHQPDDTPTPGDPIGAMQSQAYMQSNIAPQAMCFDYETDRPGQLHWYACDHQHLQRYATLCPGKLRCLEPSAHAIWRALDQLLPNEQAPVLVLQPHGNSVITRVMQWRPRQCQLIGLMKPPALARWLSQQNTAYQPLWTDPASICLTDNRNTLEQHATLEATMQTILGKQQHPPWIQLPPIQSLCQAQGETPWGAQSTNHWLAIYGAMRRRHAHGD